MSALQVIWFLLVGVLFTGYAILDGFDLGVGFWYLFAPANKDRRAMLNAIGPVWDGNEVWLIAGGGALFAAFPYVYATVFSGLYFALMLALFALIFRAVSLEFRSKVDSTGWRRTWDIAFAGGSTLAALLFGVAVGNILRGLPLDESMNYIGTFWDLLNPYALLVGVFALAMFATHGGLYLWLKADGDLKRCGKYWARKAWIIFVCLFVAATVLTIIFQSQLVQNWMGLPILWLAPFVTLLAIISIRVYVKLGHPGKAFAASSISIVGLMAIGAISIFPNMVPALNNPAHSLTIGNASSSPLTLKTMLIIAIVGMPFVLWYSIWVHRTFAKKTSEALEVY
jgi:cytochrome d ubiquinol oxidase subunit II